MLPWIYVWFRLCALFNVILIAGATYLWWYADPKVITYLWKSILKLVLKKQILELNIEKVQFFPFIIENFGIILAEDEWNGVPKTQLRWKAFEVLLEWDLIKKIMQSYIQDKINYETDFSNTLLHFKFTEFKVHCPNLSYPIILNPGSNATNIPYSSIINKCRSGSSKFTKAAASCFEITFDLFELDFNLPIHHTRIMCSADTMLICCDKNGSKLPNAVLGINSIVNGKIDIYYSKVKAFSLFSPKCIMSCDYDLPSGCQDVKGELLTTTNIIVDTQPFLEFFKAYQICEDNSLEYKLALGLNSNGKMTSMTAMFDILDVHIKDDRSKTLYNEEDELYMQMIAMKASLQTFMKTDSNQLFRYQDFMSNLDRRDDSIILSSNLRKIMTASIERINWNHAQYIEKIHGSITRDIFNENNFVDDEMFDLSFDDVCFDQLRPYFIDWLLVLMEVSNSLPNSRFSHSKTQSENLRVNKMIVGVIPEAMAIASEMRDASSSSISLLESSYKTSLSRIDKMISFAFTNTHITMKSVPNTPQHYTVNFDHFDIHTSLFTQTLQNEYGIHTFKCKETDSDRRVGSHWLFDSFSIQFKMTPVEMNFQSFNCKSLLIEMYTSNSSDGDSDISYRFFDCATTIQDGAPLMAISSLWDDDGNVEHEIGYTFIDLSIIRLLKIQLYFEMISNAVNAIIANLNRIKSLTPRDTILLDKQKKLISNTNPVQTIRFIAKFDIRFCLMEYDAKYFNMNCVVREEAEGDNSDASIPRFLSIKIGYMEYTTSNDYACYSINEFNIYVLEIPYRPMISISDLKLAINNDPYEIPDNLVADDNRLVGMYKVYSLEIGAMNLVLSSKLKQSNVFGSLQEQSDVFNDCSKYRRNFVINEHLALKNKYTIPPINYDDDVSYLYNMSFGSPEQSSYLSNSDQTVQHDELATEDDTESVSISVCTIDDDFKSINGNNIHNDYHKYIDDAADIDVSKFFALNLLIKTFKVSFDGYDYERNITLNYMSDSKEFIENLHELHLHEVKITLDAAFDSNLVDNIIDILDTGADESNKSRPIINYVNATGGDFNLFVGELQLKSKFLDSNSVALTCLNITGPLYSASISDEKIFKYSRNIALPDIIVNDTKSNLFSDNYIHTLDISTAPGKIYSELVVDMKHFTLIVEEKSHTYDESRNDIIDSCTPKDAEVDDEAAEPLSWWDNCRYWLHGNIIVKMDQLDFLYDMSKSKDFNTDNSSKVQKLQQANDILIFSSLKEFSMYVDSSKVELLASDIYLTADMSMDSNNVAESDILTSVDTRKDMMLTLKKHDKSSKKASRKKRRSFRIVHLNMEEVIANNKGYIQYIKTVESSKHKNFQEYKPFQSASPTKIERDGEYYSSSKEFRRVTNLCYIPTIVFGLHHKYYNDSKRRSGHHDVYRNTPRRSEDGKLSDKFENFRSLPYSATWCVELLVKDLRHSMDERPLGIFIRLDVLKRLLYSIDGLSYQQDGRQSETGGVGEDDHKIGECVTLGNITQQIELQFELSRFIICSWKNGDDPEGVVFHQNNMNMKMRLLRDLKREFLPEYLHIKLENSEIYGRVWDIDITGTSESTKPESVEPIVSSEVIELFTDRAKLSHASKVEIYLSKFGLKMDQEIFQSIGIIDQKNLVESIPAVTLQKLLEADEDADTTSIIPMSPVFAIGNDRRKTSNAVLRHDGKLSATETLRNSSITPSSSRKSITPKIKKFHSEGYTSKLETRMTGGTLDPLIGDFKLNVSGFNSLRPRIVEYTPFIFFRNSFRANHEAFAPPLTSLPKGTSLRRRSTKIDKPNVSNENNDKSWNLKIEDFKLLWTIELYHLMYSYCIKHYEMHHPLDRATEDEDVDIPKNNVTLINRKDVDLKPNSRKGRVSISSRDYSKDYRKKSNAHVSSQDLSNKLLNLYNIKQRKSTTRHKRVKLREQEGVAKEAPRINYFDVTLVNPQMNFLDTKTNSSLIMKTGEASLTGFKQANIIKFKSEKIVAEKEDDSFQYKRKNEIQLKMDGVSAFTIKSKLDKNTYDPIINWYDASGNNTDMRAAIQDFELNAFYSWYEDLDKNKIQPLKFPLEERDIELEYQFILDLPSITLDVSSQQYFILYNVAFNVLLAPPPSHLTKEQKNAAKGLRRQFATKDHIIQLPRPSVVGTEKSEADVIRDILKNYMVEGLSGSDLTAKKTVSLSIDEGKWILRDNKFEEIVVTGFVGVNASFSFEMDKKIKIHAEIQRFWVIDNEHVTSTGNSSAKPSPPYDDAAHFNVEHARQFNNGNINWVIKPFVDSTDKRFNFKCARCKEDFFIDVKNTNKSVCTIHEDEYGNAGAIVSEESCNDLNQIVTTEVWSCCRFPKYHAGCKSKPHKFERKMIELEVRRFPPVQIENFPMDMNVIEYANIDIFKKDYNSNESGVLESRITKELYDSLNEYFNLSLSEDADVITATVTDNKATNDGSIQSSNSFRSLISSFLKSNSNNNTTLLTHDAEVSTQIAESPRVVTATTPTQRKSMTFINNIEDNTVSNSIDHRLVTASLHTAASSGSIHRPRSSMHKDDDSTEPVAVHRGSITVSRPRGTTYYKDESVPETDVPAIKNTRSEGFYFKAFDIGEINASITVTGFVFGVGTTLKISKLMLIEKLFIRDASNREGGWNPLIGAVGSHALASLLTNAVNNATSAMYQFVVTRPLQSMRILRIGGAVNENEQHNNPEEQRKRALKLLGYDK